MMEQLKMSRATHKRKFTRKANLLKESHQRRDPLPALKSIYKEIGTLCDEIEVLTEKIIQTFDCSDANYGNYVDEQEAYMTEVERVKNECNAMIVSMENDKSEGIPKVRMQRLTPPKFDGKIREYPTFRKDYERLMTSQYEDDPYVLRSCLSGEALEVVKGVDDSFSSMMERLDEKYGNTSKVVEAVLSEIKSLKVVPEGNSKRFIELVEVVERADLDLKKLNLSTEMNTVTMVSHVEKLLPTIQKREWVKILHTITNQKMIFSELLKYLLREKRDMEYINSEIRENESSGRVQVNTVNMEDNGNMTVVLARIQGKQERIEESLINLTKQVSAMATTSNVSNNFSDVYNNGRCWYHGVDNHSISQCTGFQKLSDSGKIEAVRQVGACFMCLQTGHVGRNCPVNILCSECGKGHHRLLHGCFSKSQTRVNNNLISRQGVLLMINTVMSDKCPVTTLWDSGSNMTLITDRMAKKVGLRGKSVNLTVTKVGNERNKIETMEYEVPVIDCQGKIWMIRACGISEITSETCQVDTSKVADILGVKRDDIKRPHGKVELLIGSDYCGLFPSVVRTTGNLQLMQGPFGYCIRGSHPLLKTEPNNNSLVCIRINHISGVYVNDLVVESVGSVTKRLDEFFDVENLGTHCIPKCGNCRCGKCPIGGNKYSIKEERELSLIIQGLTYDRSINRWTAAYPWVRNPGNLPNNVSVTAARLCSTEKRLTRRGREYAKEYGNQIQDMVSRGVARKLTKQEMDSYHGPVYYLPHHEILKPESKSTPMRIVFNSSASYMGHVLNDYYAKGPDVLSDLMGILLRFRQGPMAIAGDISKMYNSVLISKLDQMTHRFLWRNMEVNREPDHYCLQTVTFGDRPSGIIAITALHETAKMFSTQYPEASSMILKDSYVDDILHSCETKIEAQNKIQATEAILGRGGFKIKQWVLSGNHDTQNDMNVIDTDSEKVLGMMWKPKQDIFGFKVRINFSKKQKNVRSEPDILVNDFARGMPKTLTKRLILSQVASLYDPLGLVTPFTIQCKLLMRQLITYKQDCGGVEQTLGWDDPIPNEMYDQWARLFKEMYELENIAFDRCIKPATATGNPTLVMYSDASNVAYSTCAYVRFKLLDGTYSAQLLASKSRIAPIRQITMPRLELCAAVMSSRLRKVIQKETNFEFDRVLHLVDSMIVRSQIQKESHGFGTFVATRIAEIQTLTDPNEWWWVASGNNAADCATRPQSPDSLGLGSSWQAGPQYLRLPIDQWPISRPPLQELPDRSGISFSLNSETSVDKCTPVIDIERFSRYERLIRTTAMVMLIFRNKSFNSVGNKIDPGNLSEAEEYWVKLIQDDFGDTWEKRFERLGPRKDERDIIVVGERIQKWLKDHWNQGEFVLLPRAHPFTRLYIQHLHDIDHGGVEMTLSKLQTRFWVPGARKVIKSVRERCVICKRIDKAVAEQQMGPLPESRLKPAPAFYNTALDLFGPLMIRDNVKRRVRAKAYGVIFTCMTSRAVHVDLAEGYDTNSFLSAFRRFVALRGYPHTIHSDLGTQLIAANKEIREMTAKWNLTQVSRVGVNQGMTWSFNKSANAPWQNGVCEALIKSVKRLLLIAIGENVLTFGELQTVLYEVANLLNERPIGMKPGCDIALGTYLCPNDLLLGRASNQVPKGPMIDTGDVRKRFSLIQSIVTSFWKRWMRDYFPTLIIRQKWHTAKRNLEKGDIVLVQDSDAIRGNWKMAEVWQVEENNDGKVRDVTLRHKPANCGNSYSYTGQKDRFIKRSVHRLVVILPIEDQ